MLHIKNVSKVFSGAVILNQINITMGSNSIIGLAGPSGSGKSTLLRCIQKLEKVDMGQINCDLKVGYMFQDFQLFPHMSVLDNLTYAAKINDKEMNHEQKALALLQSLNIVDKVNAYPHQLSGGQKQRVALARSLMMNPDLLLCDEPTSGLDSNTTNDVLNLLTQIKDKGVSMIIVSHDLSFLTKIAERMIVINKGSLVADFNTSQVAQPELYLQQFYQEEKV